MQKLLALNRGEIAIRIMRAATELGYTKSNYILTNYLSLYVEDCRRKGIQPENMLFSNKSR